MAQAPENRADQRDKQLANLSRGRTGPNKSTILAKTAIAEAAQKLGGTDRLVAWAQEHPDNERVFWSSLYTKLIPVQTELTGKDGGPIQTEQRVLEDADAFTRGAASLAARMRAAGMAGGTVQ